MKEIGKCYYDGTGLCPRCGAGLVPVPIYSAARLGSHVSRKRQDINTVVKTTTVQYADIRPLFVGCCLDCEEREHSQREEARAANKPNPVSMIVAAAVLVVAVTGIALGIRGDGTADVHTAGGVFGIVSIFVSFPALIWFVWALAAYLSKNRKYRKYASGWRGPFQAPSEETMSSLAATYMNKQAGGDREYLSIGQVERMNNPLYGR